MGNKEAALRIGQAAAQLGVTAYHLRQLCKCGLIEAEQSPGGQYRVPLSEVERLQSEGVPVAPTFIEEEEPGPAAPAPVSRPNRLAPPSPAVIGAVEDAEIEEATVRRKESTVHKLRLELEEQEVQDQLEARGRRQDALEAAERQKAATALAQQLRRKWLDEWLHYALNSLPYGAYRETELEIHGAVEAALTSLQPNQPRYIVQRLVDAAVGKALRPWKRQQEIKRAIESAMNKLAWEVRSRSEFAALKQRAWEAAVAAVAGIRAEAGYDEMETAAIQAVQPMVREYDHLQACQRVLSWVYVSGATSEEQEDAKGAIQNALAALPIGATQKQLDNAKQAALVPFEAAVAKREQAAKLEAEQQRKRRDAESKVSFQLDHVERYLQQEYEFDGGYFEMAGERDRLRPLIKAALVEELMRRDMSAEEIRRRIERLCRKL
jgi:excisionase family DNA binding protein